MKNFPKSVKTGEYFIPMGKVLGNVKVDRIEVKGCPTAWVDACLAQNQNLKEVAGRCFRLACEENKRYRHEAGAKQGHKIFWRNAFGYANNLLKKSGKPGINKEEAVVSVEEIKDAE